MDEHPVQMIGETRMPVPATKQHTERIDYRYQGKGRASISCSPISDTGIGKRIVPPGRVYLTAKSLFGS
jgi:hypothetical protein